MPNLFSFPGLPLGALLFVLADSRLGRRFQEVVYHTLKLGVFRWIGFWGPAMADEINNDLFAKINLDHILDIDLRGIGSVALAWSYLERCVERISWLCARLPEKRALCFTTHMGIRNRYDAALAALREEFPQSDMEEAFASMKHKITSELYGLRNEIVHSRVLFFEATNTSLRRTYNARGVVKSDVKPIDPGEYKEATQKFFVPPICSLSY